MDGQHWVTLREHKNDTALTEQGSTHTWAIKGSDSTPVRHVRVKLTGVNSGSNHYLSLSGIEVYGAVVGVVLDPVAPQVAARQSRVAEVTSDPPPSTYTCVPRISVISPCVAIL